MAEFNFVQSDDNEDVYHLEVPKGFGSSMCKTIYDAYCLEYKSYRPIGFSLEGFGNSLLEFGEGIFTRPPEFLANLIKMTFVSDSGKDLIVESYNFTGELTDKMLDKESVSINVLNSCLTGKTLFKDMSGKNYTIKIYFRLSSGSHSESDNNEFLVNENMIDPSSVQPMSSYHRSHFSFVANYEDYTYKTDRVILKVSPEKGLTIEEIEESLSSYLGRFYV